MFQTPYAVLFLLLGLPLCAGLAWLLYGKNHLNLSSKKLLWALLAVRFIALYGIFLLLINPLLNLSSKTIEKPVIVVAIDNSKSVVLNKDSAYYFNTFNPSVQNLINNLSKQFQVQLWAFGSSIINNQLPTYNQRQTNMAQVFYEAKNTFANLNLGAIVIASDGIYNQGENPQYAAQQSNIPVYTIALGDTTAYKDLQLLRVKHNDVVFEGSTFNILASVKSIDISKQNITIRVEHNNTTIHKAQFSANGNEDYNEIIIPIKAQNEGLQTYTLYVEHLPGEATYVNNSLVFQVNVLKSKQKILLVAQAPHPDLGAYKQAIESNAGYQAEITYLDGINETKLKNADMLVFYQLPGLRNEGFGLVQFALQQNIPALLILGATTNSNAITQLPLNVKISANINTVNQAVPVSNNAFSLFLVEPTAWDGFAKLPPLITPYANYQLPADAQVLFNQQIGAVKTNNPLVFFVRNQSQITGIIAGEGFWRWRLNDFLTNGNQELTNGLTAKIVQLIASKNDNAKFRVKPVSSVFYETDEVAFEAELYNEANELTNASEAILTIKNKQSGKIFNFNFSKNGNAYQLNAGTLPQGDYEFTAKAKTYTKSGSFKVLPQLAEYNITTANHKLLNSMASETGGKFYYANELNQLEKDLINNNTIKPVIYENKSVKELLHVKWLLFVIVALLSIEWFIRKYNGYI